MEPTSRGFSEVRDVFFKELVEISKNSLNGGGKEKVGEVSHSAERRKLTIQGESRSILFCHLLRSPAERVSSSLPTAAGAAVHAGLPPGEDAELL